MEQEKSLKQNYDSETDSIKENVLMDIPGNVRVCELDEAGPRAVTYLGGNIILDPDR